MKFNSRLSATNQILGFRPSIIILSIALSILFCSCGKQSSEKTDHTEILWDTWGVPHIFARNATGLFYAYGWSQMESHGNLILRLYGQARGRAAEYWGESYRESDRYIHTLGVPGRGRIWYKAQNRTIKEYLDAFAEGINVYAESHSENIANEVKCVLPVKPEDTLAHLHRILHLFFVGIDAGPMAQRWGATGSNGWAIAPSHTAGGNAMLLANPHLPWSDLFLFHEAQLIAPGVDIYGVSLVGLPALVIAFNDYLGWTQTTNPFDGMDLYELTLVDNGYSWDGGIRAFDTEKHVLKVKQKNGSLHEEQLTVRRSVHGPVIAEKEGKALAVRMVGLDQPHIFEQYWEMMQATSLEEFEKALKRLQMPMQNFIYADREGHIMYLFSGRVPKRATGDWNYWQGIIPGDTKETLWTETHPYSDLPRIVDPPSGWVQNANDPPWYATFPMLLDPDDFPSYIAPIAPWMMGFRPFRPQRSVRMLTEDEKITFEELIEYKHSTRMELADRILDDLIPAARKHGSHLAQKAAGVLEAWDREADADSRGTVLFYRWAQKIGYFRYASNPPWGGVDPGVFAIPWSEQEPLTTPDGLKNPGAAVKALEAAAESVLKQYGALDVPWGDVFRIRYAGKDYPGNGGPDQFGIFRTIYFTPDVDGCYRSVAGDTYIAAVEFSDPVRAEVLLGYGNSSQPDSPHRGDQLELFARKKLRPVWRTREEIEKHLEKREVF